MAQSPAGTYSSVLSLAQGQSAPLHLFPFSISLVEFLPTLSAKRVPSTSIEHPCPCTPERVAILKALVARPELSLYVLNTPIPSANGLTPLALACSTGTVEQALALLECPSVLVDARDARGATPLMCMFHFFIPILYLYSDLNLRFPSQMPLVKAEWKSFSTWSVLISSFSSIITSLLLIQFSLPPDIGICSFEFGHRSASPFSALPTSRAVAHDELCACARACTRCTLLFGVAQPLFSAFFFTYGACHGPSHTSPDGPEFIVVGFSIHGRFNVSIVPDYLLHFPIWPSVERTFTIQQVLRGARPDLQDVKFKSAIEHAKRHANVLWQLENQLRRQRKSRLTVRSDQAIALRVGTDKFDHPSLPLSLDLPKAFIRSCQSFQKLQYPPLLLSRPTSSKKLPKGSSSPSLTRMSLCSKPSSTTPPLRSLPYPRYTLTLVPSPPAGSAFRLSSPHSRPLS